MSIWFSQNNEWITALLAFFAVVVPIVIYLLSIQQSEQELLQHKENIQKKLREHEMNIRSKNYASEVRLIDTDRYRKEYPTGVNSRRYGVNGKFVDLKAELKECRFDGVEFFVDMPIEAKQNAEGKVEIVRGSPVYDFVVFPVGKVPYEWIDFVNLDGDEYHNFPLVHCRFKGKGNTPYKEILYYQKQKNDYYREVEICL